MRRFHSSTLDVSGGVERWTLDVERGWLSAQTGNAELIRLLRSEIRAQGPVSFAWFMEQALYHPEHGYYSSGRAAIGRRGDYFTNVSVGPLFGRLLAAQFAEIWKKLGQIENFVIVEQGGHHGELARDVLEALRQNSPEFFCLLHYRIIEPSRVLQDRQSQMLADFRSKVDWRDAIDVVEPFSGVHFSNELLDALPVHLIVSADDAGSMTWREKRVGLEGDRFIFVEQSIAHSALQARLRNLAPAPVGYETELHLAALDWIEKLSAKLTRGYLLTVDYGLPRDELYASHRSTGTLQVRAQHRHLSSPFEQIGQADITAHVDWTSLVERAQANGLQVLGFTDQHHFLTGIISEWPQLVESIDPPAKRALQTLLHPEMLGRSFQALALGKDVDPRLRLSGFKFARNARGALGLVK